MKRGLLVLALIFLVPIVYAAQTPPGPAYQPTMDISDCKIMAACTGEFQAFGWVSSEGHFTEDVDSDFPYALCCKNLVNKGSGAISFRYAIDPNYAEAQGHVSLNSSKTNFLKPVKMGFPGNCTLKDDCNLANSEICLFKVCDSYPACRLNSSHIYSIDNSHIADCNTPNVPFNNAFTKQVCCKFEEICDDGIDNDGDFFIDCADENCKTTGSNTLPPAICTNSPYDADTCVVNYTLLPDGTVVVLYNQTCVGQPPFPSQGTYPVVNPPLYQNGEMKPPVWYCSYGQTEDPEAGSPGVCCQSGTYAEWDSDQNVWTCTGSAPCGLDPAEYPCEYDFDLNNPSWLSDYYSGNSDEWCVSRFPYFYTPDNISYAPRRSTGCCLTEYHGDVDYYTAEDNVKIFGYTWYCGDGVVDMQTETCDGNDMGTCAENGATCVGNYVLVGSPGCVNCQINATAPYCNCTDATAQQQQQNQN